ncbi:MAG: DUF429 domain-containing protein [Candidatus Bathyarchaeota archaeon]|nr:DUF429 domain-containing protein [Candidatus Bathyarchaeota archaeon A05DMB-5]MDH7557243.1 DUF429 domain-containing protein [Candidatus Bathyarchaeota archaeon]
MKKECIIGIDLAGTPKNPSGWAFWKNKKIKACLLYDDQEILENITKYDPVLIAIDAPFSFPRKGLLRKADREMIRKGYRVFPPVLTSMRMLTLRAIKLNKLIGEKGYNVIEVHPTSTRKALGMPLKNWGEIQTAFKNMGLEDDIRTRVLTPHELDAITAALTAYLHIHNHTEAIGDKAEGYIIVPKRQDWRTMHI